MLNKSVNQAFNTAFPHSGQLRNTHLSVLIQLCFHRFREVEGQGSLIHGPRRACASLPPVKNLQKQFKCRWVVVVVFFFFGSKISKGCFDMKTLGLESWKALEIA